MAGAQLSRILPKLHWRLMPTLLMMYVLAFLDRSNVSFAKMGLAADAGVGETAFAFGASIFFLGYAFLEVPSNLILHRVGASELRIDVPLPPKPNQPPPVVTTPMPNPNPMPAKPPEKRLTRLEKLRLEQEEREKAQQQNPPEKK